MYTKRAFSLIEILVVVAVVGILSSFVVVSASAVRTKGNIAANQETDAALYHNLGDSLIGQWLFDDGSVTDSSGYNNASGPHGVTFTSNVPFASGQALVFNGTADYVTIDGSRFNFGVNQDFAVSLWIKPAAVQPDAATYDNSIVEKWSGNGGYPFVIRYENQTSGANGKIAVGRYNGSTGAGMISTRRINDGKYHFITFTKRGTKTYLYIDGTLEGWVNDITTGDTTNTSNLFLGMRGGGSNHFAGAIDSLRIYDRGLDVSDVQKAFAEEAANHHVAVL